jgi:U3 small nucleolar RNA-associated protein 7
VAQKGWTYIYDNEGIEVHCLKKLDRIYSMDFLPYHFLLVAGHESGFLSWVDVSIGKIVAQYKSRAGPVPNILTTNQANAVTMCGHSNGTVTMWAPSVKDPLATMLCHGSPLSAIGVDTVGRLMATGSYDGTLRLWDLRNNYVPLTTCKVGIPTALNFSQRGMLAMSTANQSLVFSEIGTRQKPYLKHVSHSNVSSLKFCPFEDVLGIGSHDGFQSILVPGAGEANYDALERNPFQSKGQRKEAEVKALLDKIQPELITLDNSLLGEVDTVAIEDELQAKPKYVKKAEIELSHRKKRKNAKLPKIKAGLQAELNIKQAKSVYQQSKQEQEEGQLPIIPQVFSNPLDRFKPKKKRN